MGTTLHHLIASLGHGFVVWVLWGSSDSMLPRKRCRGEKTKSESWEPLWQVWGHAVRRLDATCCWSPFHRADLGWFQLKLTARLQGVAQIGLCLWQDSWVNSMDTRGPTPGLQPVKCIKFPISQEVASAYGDLRQSLLRLGLERWHLSHGDGGAAMDGLTAVVWGSHLAKSSEWSDTKHKYFVETLMISWGWLYHHLYLITLQLLSCITIYHCRLSSSIIIINMILHRSHYWWSFSL